MKENPIDKLHALGLLLDDLRVKVRKTLPYNNGYLTTEQIYILCAIKKEISLAEEELLKQTENESNTNTD
jgi:hypothetical protein